MSAEISIEIVSDYVCPWCYVGKRRLEKVLESRPDLQVEIRWSPFQLSPQMPREGVDRVEHYNELFGEERATAIMESMQQTGADEGIAFGYKPGARSPNTLLAHTLMYRASHDESIDQDSLAEKLFHAHHVDCSDIGDLDVLTEIASEAGMQPEQVRTELGSGQDEGNVHKQVQFAQEKGVTGVPFFILNGRYALSGAQPVEVMRDVLDQVLAAEASDQEESK
ncbi:MAG: DsbA family oxidoreductase [Gammaproteobacteria bacterium]